MPAGKVASQTRILVIDDNPIDRDLFRRLLRQNGGTTFFESVEGENGRAGLEQFRRSHPQVVLLDLNLPDVDGLDLLRSILAEDGACPVIVTTAYGSEQVAVQAMKAGAADYVVKGSITAEGLAHVIGNALEKRALQEKIEQQRLALEDRNRQLESALERETAVRKAAERSESRYRTLSEAMPQIVWTADHPGGEWDYVNQRWSRLTGANAARAFGKGWLDFVDAEDRARVAAAWNHAVAAAAPLELECRMQPETGGPRLHLVRALPLFQDDVPVKWLGTCTDIEEQRRAERLLHQRQKLESIGILAGGVAHDFNNLLVGIIGGVSYALETLPPAHELRGILENALKSGDRAANLVRQMLAYAGKGSFQVEEVDLGQVLRTTADLVGASIPRSIDMKILVAPDLPPIRTDATQLQQIIMNLIINASEAMPSDRDGLIAVRAEVTRVETPRSTSSGDLAPGNYVSLEVRDNGAGIDPGVLHRIFDPFFTTKFTGRGLGLAAVQGIVRSNRGSIDVESTPGKGTTFRVLLPAVERGSGSAPPVPKPEEAGARGRILVVDDEPVVSNTARLLLEKAGHSVSVAFGGEEALGILSAAPRNFSLVLLDLNMPGMDGEQTLTRIRAIDPDLPVIICSGYSERELRHRFEGRTVNGYLQKPFHLAAIRQKVSAALRPA